MTSSLKATTILQQLQHENDNVSGTDEFTADAEDYLYPGEQYVDPKANCRRAPTTIVYAATDSNKLKEPELLIADPDSLDVFRLKYLKYVRDHGIKQRRRPRSQRTPPLSVHLFPIS